MWKTTVGIVLGLVSIGHAATSTLTWEDPFNAPGSVTEYRIERSDDQQTTWTQIGTVAGGTFTFQDTDATTAHCYRVLAANAETVSAPSNVACAPLASPQHVTITLTFGGSVR